MCRLSAILFAVVLSKMQSSLGRRCLSSMMR